jgi:predicted nucleic acid-binding protein
MADAPKRIYWDTSMFLCFLNKKEADRRVIAQDILDNAQRGRIEIITSWFTVAEVIRPKFVPAVQKLIPSQIAKIEGMFRWKWLKKIQVHELIAFKAVELARDYNLRPADSIHAATAVIEQVDALHAWDRDYSALDLILNVEEPILISKQTSLPGMEPQPGPTPEELGG